MSGGRDGARGEQTRVIQIELWLDGSMPAGIVTAPGGAARDFTGWVGLMSAVDALAVSDGGERTEDGW